VGEDEGQSLELASLRIQIQDDAVPFLKGRPNPKQIGCTNCKSCDMGHLVAVSNTRCTHRTGCPAGCGVTEGEGHAADAPQYTLLKRKSNVAGEAVWPCTTVDEQCPSTRFLADIKVSAEGVYSAILPANAAEINAKVDEIAKEQSGKAVDKGRAEPAAMGMASARLCMTAIGCAGVAIALNPTTGMCCMSATPLDNCEWKCDCGYNVLEKAPCAKAKDGRCLCVIALLLAKMSRQRVLPATQTSIDKITLDVLKPYVATASASSRKKPATSPPEGEISSASKLATQEASSRNSGILHGAQNLTNIALGLARSLATRLGSDSPRCSPPPVTPSFIIAARDWASHSPIALEVFRCSFEVAQQIDFDEVAKLAAQERRGVADGSIAGCAFADALLRSGVAGNGSYRTSLLKGVPRVIVVGKDDDQQVLHSAISTSAHGPVLACVQLCALYVRGNVFSCKLNLLLLIKVL